MMLQRRVPLRRTPLRSGGLLRKVAAKVTRPPSAGPAGVSALVLAQVLHRTVLFEDPTCEVCGWVLIGERGLAWSVHHRRFRDGRPDSHLPQNLLVVHGASNVDRCHGRIHGDKREAIANGWAISRHGAADPLDVPVLTARGWVLFDDEGGWRPW